MQNFQELQGEQARAAFGGHVEEPGLARGHVARLGFIEGGTRDDRDVLRVEEIQCAREMECAVAEV